MDRELGSGFLESTVLEELFNRHKSKIFCKFRESFGENNRHFDKHLLIVSDYQI